MAARFDIEKFNGRNDFNLWWVRMKALLVQQGLSKALKGKDALPESLTGDEKEEILEKAHSTIQLCLSNEVLREVVEEDRCQVVVEAGELVHDQITHKSLVFEEAVGHTSYA